MARSCPAYAATGTNPAALLAAPGGGADAPDAPAGLGLVQHAGAS